MTQASLTAMAKNDPLLFALSELLAVERSKGTLKVDTVTKTDIQIALLDRIATATAKTANLQDDHARFQQKYLNLLK
jgi:hypothetical protein